MTTKTPTIKKLENARSFVMKTAKTAHNTILGTTEEFIEGSINTAEKVQKLTAKTIKKTEPIVEKQVDIMFDAAEEVFVQIEKGSERFQKLLGITDQVTKVKKYVSKSVKMTSKTLEDNYEYVAKNAKEVAAKVEDKFEDITKTVKQNAKATVEKVEGTLEDISKTVKTSSTKAEKTVVKTTAKAKKDTKVTVKAVKKTAKKAVAEVKAIAEVTLNDIKGVGPKMQETLKAAGINNVADLANANAKELNEVLANANPRYKSFDPAPWIADAKIAVEAKK